MGCCKVLHSSLTLVTLNRYKEITYSKWFVAMIKLGNKMTVCLTALLILSFIKKGKWLTWLRLGDMSDPHCSHTVSAEVLVQFGILCSIVFVALHQINQHILNISTCFSSLILSIVLWAEKLLRPFKGNIKFAYVQSQTRCRPIWKHLSYLLAPSPTEAKTSRNPSKAQKEMVFFAMSSRSLDPNASQV